MRTGLLYAGIRLIWLGGLLAAIALRPHAAQAQQTPDHETLCAFSMRATDAWQRVPHAQNAGLQRIPSSPEPAYYQSKNGSATMVVYCAPRVAPEVDFETSVAREVSAVSHSYTAFSVIGHDRFDFQQVPAQWFLFSGSLKRRGIAKDGYMIVADRGERSLVIALDANADPNHGYSKLFRTAVQLFTLR